ncbi:MAG: thiamine phosphate synthase [Caulobacteraceae bacterium]
MASHHLCRLYLITPPVIDDPAAFARTLNDALEGGDVAALQVRLKDVSDDHISAVVRAVQPVAFAREVAVILNDRPDLAASLNCDGVHIGQDDGSYADARRTAGKDAMVGVTCHDSRDLAYGAAEAGADYVAFGAFFDTATKQASTRADPEMLTIWQETMQTPCVAIGGITAENAAGLAEAGADFIAVSSGVWSHRDGARAGVAALNAAIADGVKRRLAKDQA